MRILLSTIGSRGDVQPLVALASELTTLGAAVRLCVPPDFQAWIEELGFPVTPIGPSVQRFAASAAPASATRPSADQLRQLAAHSVATQFATVTEAAADADVIVAATALQVAARSVAEVKGIRYVFAAYCPQVFPSPLHPPLLMSMPGGTAGSVADNRALWARDAERFHETFGAALNAHRASLGLLPVDDARAHMFGETPWLAADPTLGPWGQMRVGSGSDADPTPDPTPIRPQAVFQTGAWILRDERPLSDELERFLAAGTPPVYFGFGSTHGAPDVGRVMLQAARAVGRRAIVSRGWSGLSPDEGADCLAIDDTNLRELFRRVAIVVHHGGAGTTTLAALAGTPQVVIPQQYDQHYWARRVAAVGIGAAHAPGAPTVESLTAALEQTLASDVTRQATAIAGRVREDGAQIAARAIVG